MKSDYRIRAQKFIKQIFQYVDGHMYDDLDETIERVQRFAAEKHRKVLVNNGVSRIAIITADYVIKWDRHFAQNNYERNYAGDCEKEYRTWRWLLDENPGYSYLFAEITRFKFGGENFYIMPRVRGINEGRDVYAYECVDGDEEDFLHEWFYDLHSGNFGIDRKGNVTIFDYAWNSLNFD